MTAGSASSAHATGSAAPVVPVVAGLALLIVLLAREQPPPKLAPRPAGAPPAAPRPATVPAQARILEVTAPEIALAPQTRYLAKLQLTGLESTFGTASAVKDKLHEIGFNPVSVWSKDPPEFFPDRMAFPSGSTYWALGDWQGPPESMKPPEQIKRAWVMA